MKPRENHVMYNQNVQKPIEQSTQKGEIQQHSTSKRTNKLPKSGFLE